MSKGTPAAPLVDLSRMIGAEQAAAQALEAAQAAALAGLQAWVEAAMVAVQGRAPLGEKLGWDAKAAAARALLAGTALPEQREMIAAEAGVTGEAPEALAARIAARSAACHLAMAQVTGLRRRAQAAILTARAPQEAEAVLHALAREDPKAPSAPG